MAKPVPPRLPPPRILSAAQNAFIQSLEPRSVHAAPAVDTLTERPVTEPTEPHIATSPENLGDQSPSQPIATSTSLLVPEETERQVAQSPHRQVTTATQRPRSRANKRQGRVVFERVSGEPVRKLSFYIPADVAKSLQLHCVTTERDMSTVVTDLVRRALAKAGV